MGCIGGGIMFGMIRIFGTEVITWFPTLGGHQLVPETGGVARPFCVVWVMGDFVISEKETCE